MTNFELVAKMNDAFGNPEGDPHAIDWPRIVRQQFNILDEFIELQKAMGAPSDILNLLLSVRQNISDALGRYLGHKDLDKVRDALCDIHVFAYGAHHLMGIDADADMESVVGAVMTRFVKDQDDLDATIKKYAELGVTEIYTEGQFPTMIVKSATDQPDAPKGKFLKAASYTEPKFYSL